MSKEERGENMPDFAGGVKTDIPKVVEKKEKPPKKKGK